MVVRNPNTGHGHVRPRPDGVVMRCGGPGICPECTEEARWVGSQPEHDPRQLELPFEQAPVIHKYDPAKTPIRFTAEEIRRERFDAGPFHDI